jgi:uncharacterized protein
VTYLLDVNLLIALLWETHEHHTRARKWLKRVPKFATCPVVQLGFARVSSHPLLGYGMSPDQSFGILRKFIADPRHDFLSDDVSSSDRIFRTDLLRGSNQVTDGYLVALAVRHNCKLATFDEELASTYGDGGASVELVH